MQRITREQARKYAFDWRDEPLLRVQPGESFEIETYDASTGYFKTPSRQGHSRQAARLRPQRRRSPIRSAARSISKAPSAATRWSSPSRRSSSTIIRGSPSARAAARSANRRAGRNCPSDYTTKIFRHTPGPSGTTRDGTLHFNEQDLLADHAVHRHPRRRPGSRGDDQPRRPGRMGRQPRHPRRVPRQPHPAADLPPRRAVLPRRRPRQPGRHRVHRHRRRDEGDRAASSSTCIKGKRIPWMRIEKPDVAGRRPRRPAAGSGGRDGDDQPDGLADHASTASRRRTRTAW